MKKLPVPAKLALLKIGIPVILGLILLYILLKKFNIIKPKVLREAKAKKTEEKAEKKIIKSIIEESGYFDVNLHKSYPDYKLLPAKDAIQKAKDLRAGIRPLLILTGGLGTNEAKIYGVFRSLTNKIQVSQIANEYLKKYNRDLLADLQSDLTKAELQTVFSIIKSKS